MADRQGSIITRWQLTLRVDPGEADRDQSVNWMALAEVFLVVQVFSGILQAICSSPSAGIAMNADARFQVYQDDAVAWLRSLADASVDLIITDPPYESLEKHRSIGTTTRLKQSKASSNQWFQIFPNDRFEELFTELYRVLKKNRHFYLFCDAETMFIAKPIAEQAGFRFWKPLVWDKQKIGMGYHYRSRYELILFFEKGKRKLQDLSIPDIIECPRIFRGYPTEKPVAVSKVLIQQSAVPHEIVIDPFMGSGSTGVATLQQGCRFWGNDICQEAVDISYQRLLDLTLDNEVGS